MILLLFPFHAAQIWSGGEHSGFYVWSHTNIALHVFSTAVYPWYMTLLFAIAGMSGRYSLQKRTAGQFAAERAKKILVPFLFGLLVLAPSMTYVAERFFNEYGGGYLHQYVLFFTKPTDFTGYRGGFTPGHLWFLLYLFVISLTLLLIIALQKKCLPELRPCNPPYFALVLLFVPEWLCQYALNIGGKSLAQFLLLYLVGYYVLSEERVLHTLARRRFVSIALCVLSGTLYVYLYCFRNLTGVLITALYIFYGWAGILTLLGMGQTTLDFCNRLSDYLSRASFPIYILHMPLLVATGFFVLKLPLAVAVQFLLIVLISAAATFLLYEIARRISVLRFLLGMKHKPRRA